MHSYVLLKYCHRQYINCTFSVLHVSIHMDHHQGVLLVLVKLLIKIIKLLKVKYLCSAMCYSTIIHYTTLHHPHAKRGYAAASPNTNI